MTNNPPQLKDRILEKIATHEISMRPKLFFTLKLVALVVVAFFAVSISIFILNFMLFSIRINSHDALLGFGPRGLEAFVRFFPWPFLAVDAVLVLALQSLLRQFRFGYKTPALYLLVGLILSTVLLGFVVDRGTGFNDDVLGRADRHELMWPIGEFYEHARMPPPPGSGVCKCTVVSINGTTLTVQDTRSTTTLTVLLPQDDPHATTTNLKVGDVVFIAGDIKGDVLYAFGLHPISHHDGAPELEGTTSPEQ